MSWPALVIINFGIIPLQATATEIVYVQQSSTTRRNHNSMSRIMSFFMIYFIVYTIATRQRVYNELDYININEIKLNSFESFDLATVINRDKEETTTTTTSASSRLIYKSYVVNFNTSTTHRVRI